ncbi:MAG: glutathione S-transferase N-terminal domain-containing protein [Pseudomonadota bacterium]
MSAPETSLTLYYYPTPNGKKISIMLAELGWAYDLEIVDITKGDQFKPSFLEISPNNRMPVLVDRDGPDGQPISVFESGAILQYLGRKSGQFYPSDERARVEVEEWLFWQVGGLGPMAGQCHHFLNYAPEKVPYGINRYVNEVNRLYGVLERRLAGRAYVAGDYSIADMAIYPWAKLWHNQGQDIAEFPTMATWMDRLKARPGVVAGMAVGADVAKTFDLAKDKDAQKMLFGQTAQK